MWETIKDIREAYPLWAQITITMLAVGILLLLMFARAAKPTTQAQLPSSKPPDPVVAARVNEANALQAFLGGKDEGQLWEQFDLPGIMQYNIRRARTCLPGQTLSHEQAAEIDAFFKDGQAILDNRYCKVDRTAGGFHVDAIPGKLGILNISRKYINARDTLTKFKASPHLAKKIKDPLIEFEVAVADNVQILLDVINSELNEHPNHIVQEENSDSPLFGAASGTFLDKRVWLKPKQQLLENAIQQYFESQ